MKTRQGLGPETLPDARAATATEDPAIGDTLVATDPDRGDAAMGDTVVATDPGTRDSASGSRSGAAAVRGSAPLVGAGSAPAGEPSRGECIGRFVVLGVLGSGGMGVVYSAYDPHLDRKVAIKLLGAAAMRSDDAHVRLLREAQAMAKIDHPNVLRVHEAGTYGTQIYVAMEFADAGTLRRWLEARPRSLREILGAFVQAGRGLAAAHAAGLVHRDFKPDNVLMSKDGGIRVTDFGLVSVVGDERPSRAASEPMPEVPGKLSDTTPLSQDLTRTGSIMGTPTYMAPEQFSGRASTPATDQFSFCVALYEALYGARPFAGDTFQALCASVLLGEVLPPPAGAAVPAWLRRVLLRGLATDPDKRFPSMTALLTALARDPARRRRRLLGWGGAVAVLGAGAFALYTLRPDAAAACQGGGERLAIAWNPAERAKIAHAFEASPRPQAKDWLPRVERVVDDWGRSWQLAYVDACKATRERGDQSEHLLDLRMECLTRKLDATHATLELLAAGGGEAVDHALEAVRALPSVAPCADTTALTAAVRPPETAVARVQVAGVRKQLDEAGAQRRLGRYAAGLKVARDALAAARTAGYTPAVAEALLAVGQLQSDLGDVISVDTLRDAMHLAAEAGDSALLIDAAAWRIFALTTQTDHYDLAEELGQLADAVAKHAPPSAEIAVRLGDTIALLWATRGRAKESRARYEQALALAQKELGPESPGTLTTLNQLGNLAKQQGRFEDARHLLEQVVEIRERIAGKDHPDVASALNNLGNVYRVEGKLDDAKRLYERSLAIRTAALGPEHPDVGTSLNNLGTFYSDAGDEATAQTYFEKALAVWEKAYGKDNVAITSALSNLGNSLNARGDHEGARVQFERARALLEAAHGPDHPQVAAVVSNLGVVAQDEGKLDEALAHYQRAEKIAEKVYGPEHPDVADYLANITSVYKLMGKLPEAKEMTSRTLSVISKAYGPDHPRMGGALVNYGNLLVALKDYAGALESYTRADAIFAAKLGKDHPYVAFAQAGIGGALVELKRAREAVPHLERSLEIRVSTGQNPRLVAESRFGLADALVASRATRARAIREAKTALAEYAQAGDAADAAEVKAWLREH